MKTNNQVNSRRRREKKLCFVERKFKKENKKSEERGKEKAKRSREHDEGGRLA